MPITRIRGDLQIKSNTVDSEALKNSSVDASDIAHGSLTGASFIDGSIPSEKIDIATFAGEGLSYNGTNKNLDININISHFQLISGVLNAAPAVTLAGNAFNTANSLVQLDALGRLPALDGSQLTNISGGTGNFVDLEVPGGVINGSNVTFTLSSIPVSGSLHLYMNGILLRAGGGHDFTILGNVISMNYAPSSGSVLLASYRV